MPFIFAAGQACGLHWGLGGRPGQVGSMIVSHNHMGMGQTIFWGIAIQMSQNFRIIFLMHGCNVKHWKADEAGGWCLGYFRIQLPYDYGIQMIAWDYGIWWWFMVMIWYPIFSYPVMDSGRIYAHYGSNPQLDSWLRSHWIGMKYGLDYSLVD